MQARARLGWIRELQGKYRLALTDYEAALEYFESRRQSTTVPDLQIFITGNLSMYMTALCAQPSVCKTPPGRSS
jgi:hypothetical protein